MASKRMRIILEVEVPYSGTFDRHGFNQSVRDILADGFFKGVVCAATEEAATTYKLTTKIIAE